MLETLGPYLGSVTRTDDPDKSGRVQAHIPDLFSDPETGEEMEVDLWIECMSGAGNDIGIISVPPVGSNIYIWAEYSDDMNLYRMCYTRGPVRRTPESGFSGIPLAAQGLDCESVIGKPKNALPVDEDDPQIVLPSSSTKIIDSDVVEFNLPSSGYYDAVQLETIPFAGIPPSANESTYPNNHCIKTPNGLLVELDDTPEARRIHIYHPSGTYLEINNGGGWCQRQTAYYSETGGQHVSYIGGHKQEVVEDYISLKCAGKHIEHAEGNRIILGNQVALQGETNVALNSLGRMSLVSDSNLKVEGASGLEVSTGAEYTVGAGSIGLTSHGPATHLYNERFNAVFSGLNPLAVPPVNLPTADAARITFAPTVGPRQSVSGTGSHINLMAAPNPAAGMATPLTGLSPEAVVVRTTGGALTFCLDGNVEPSQALVKAAGFQSIILAINTYLAAQHAAHVTLINVLQGGISMSLGDQAAIQAYTLAVTAANTALTTATVTVMDAPPFPVFTNSIRAQ